MTRDEGLIRVKSLKVHGLFGGCGEGRSLPREIVKLENGAPTTI
jgi:hypothetical protein